MTFRRHFRRHFSRRRHNKAALPSMRWIALVVVRVLALLALVMVTALAPGRRPGRSGEAVAGN